MKSKWLGIQRCDDLVVDNLDPQVHKYHFIGALAEDPLEATLIEAVLKCFPVGSIDLRVWIM